MRFDRAILKDWNQSLLEASNSESRCIGHNFLIEENVSDERRFELECHEPGLDRAEELMKRYYNQFVQRRHRGQLPTTFNPRTNLHALQSVRVHPSRKLIRLERIDGFLNSVQGLFDFDTLNEALNGGDPRPLSLLLEWFHAFPGERPAFAAFMSDVWNLLEKAEWLPYFIDGVGLHHNYPYDPRKPNCFALMEYSAAEVIEQARAKGIERCFALPTVLEAWKNPAFCPVPRSSCQGRAVDLRGKNLARPVREILHIRFDYSPRNLKRLGAWHGAETPDICEARRPHIDSLRENWGRADFGNLEVRE